MNPTQGKPSLLSGLTQAPSEAPGLNLSPEAIAAIEKEKAAQSSTQGANKILEKVMSKVEDVPKFDVHKFIMDFEQDCLDRKHGHLGVGDYDKLLIENVQQNIQFIPEIDHDIHKLIVASVNRYDVRTRNRVNK